MKFLTIFLSLSLASVALAQEPAELVKLRNSWESQLDATKEKIDTLYFSELEELKKNFLKDHNLKNAQAVQREIDRDNRAANEPAELSKMRKIYQNSIRSAINELNKSYYKNLKNIQKDYMNAADLRQATAVEREIERLRIRHAKPADPPKKQPTVKGSSGLRESGEISNKPDLMEGRNKAGQKIVWNRLKLKAPADNKGGEIEPPAPRKSNAFQLDGRWERHNLKNGGKAVLTFKDEQVVVVNNDPLIISREDGFFKCKSATSGWWFTCKPDPNNLDVMTGMRKNGDKLIFTRVK